VEQDDLTPAARRLLKDQERLKSERLKTAMAARTKRKKLRAETEVPGFANDDFEI
jgi:hypothetical protein